MCFVKKITSLISIFLLLNSLQNCATFVGYRIGKKFDNEAEIQKNSYAYTINDSSIADSANTKPDDVREKEKKKTYYVFLGTGLGLLVDAAIFVLFVKASMSSVRPNVGL